MSVFLMGGSVQPLFHWTFLHATVTLRYSSWSIHGMLSTPSMRLCSPLPS